MTFWGTTSLKLFLMKMVMLEDMFAFCGRCIQFPDILRNIWEKD